MLGYLMDMHVDLYNPMYVHERVRMYKRLHVLVSCDYISCSQQTCILIAAQHTYKPRACVPDSCDGGTTYIGKFPMNTLASCGL